MAKYCGFLFFLLVIICSIPLNAQNSIVVNDTVITRGGVREIPVYGKWQANDWGEIKLTFEFNAYVLDIKGARGAAGLGFGEDSPVIDLNLTNLENARLTVTSENFGRGFDGIACYLVVEGLAGPEKSTELTPTGFYYNNILDGRAQLVPGVIFVQGPVITPGFSEGLGNNFPNPFTDLTNFRFSLDKPSKINFHVYKLEGSKVLPVSGFDSFEYSVIDSAGNKIENYETELLAEGNYLLELKPVQWKASAGPYFLVFETDFGVHRKNFILEK